MSKIQFSALNTLDGFKGFLQAYHEQLSSQRSFPPLGLQKALHTAAPAFGYNNWNTMSAALDQDTSELEFDHIDRWILKNGNTYLEYVLSERYDALLAEHKRLLAQGAEAKEPESIQTVVITVSDIDADTDETRSVDTTVVRNWDKAKDYVANLAYSKAIHNDRSVEEIMECESINLPDSDDIENFDDLETRDLMDWIEENNDIDNLIVLVSHLDYNLTKITVSDHWI